MDDINKYTFENVYEKCDMNIESFPLFLTSDGSLLM